MPICNGPKAVEAILQYLSVYPDMKKPYICCLSAYSNPEYENEALRSGMDKFQAKPIFSNTIEFILQEARMLIPTTSSTKK